MCVLLAHTSQLEAGGRDLRRLLIVSSLLTNIHYDFVCVQSLAFVIVRLVLMKISSSIGRQAVMVRVLEIAHFLSVSS